MLEVTKEFSTANDTLEEWKIAVEWAMEPGKEIVWKLPKKTDKSPCVTAMVNGKIVRVEEEKETVWFIYKGKMIWE